MKAQIFRWVLMVVAVVATSAILRSLGLRFESPTETAGQVLGLLLSVLLLAFLNATLGKILKLLTLPLNCLTLGLFSLVVNAFMVMLVANSRIGFNIPESDGPKRFLTALAASILISAFNGLLTMLIPDKSDD